MSLKVKVTYVCTKNFEVGTGPPLDPPLNIYMLATYVKILSQTF